MSIIFAIASQSFRLHTVMTESFRLTYCSTTLWPGDEFLVLGCDGIWDCLSNEECVKYVRDRIDSKLPHEIGREMLDEIVSADPRASQGIGGDNMTIIIVDLIPHTRPYSSGNKLIVK